MSQSSTEAMSKTAQTCFRVRPGAGMRGSTSVPGDKSISHRAVLFSALAHGRAHIRGWLPAGDTEASLRVAQALGVPIERLSPTEMIVHGGALQAPDVPLDCVNAGTGIRLLSGIMVGQPFPSVLTGSAQLRRRPMNRIIIPLRLMDADIEGVNGYAPLTIKPAALRGIHYRMPVASAQVKSAILLAGLFANGETVIVQPGPARDHTERMLGAMGADLAVDGDNVHIRPSTLQAIDFTVPGDISSAAFPIAAALLVPDSAITLTNISLNPTRTGLLDALEEMGARITVTETGLEAGDPVGTIEVRHSALTGITVGGDLVVRMIDEFPILMVLALAAEGETIVRDAGELRVKETDRLAVMTAELKKLGAVITETEDGFHIVGPQQLTGAVVDGHDDHRIAMSMAVAGMIAEGETIVRDARCAGDSYPGFAAAMAGLGADLTEQPLCEG